MKNLMITAIMAIAMLFSVVGQAESFLAGSGTFVEKTDADKLKVDGVACTWNAKTVDGGYFMEWRQGTCARDSKGNAAAGRSDRNYSIIDGVFHIEFTIIRKNTGDKVNVWLAKKGSSVEKSAPAEIPVETQESIASTETYAKEASENSEETNRFISDTLEPALIDTKKSLENAETNQKNRADADKRRDEVEACYLRVGDANDEARTAAVQAQLKGVHEADDCGGIVGSVRDKQVEGSESIYQTIGIYIGGELIDKSLCDPKAKPVEYKKIPLSVCNTDPSYKP